MQDYYWELNRNGEKAGPKRTLEFFLETVRRGKQHILDLYNPNKIKDRGLLKRSLKIIKQFGLCDSELELELAHILTSFVRMPEPDKNRLMTIYLLDLTGRFILNPEKNNNLEERKYEYASFRASADYVVIMYGMGTRPVLELTKAEAEILKKGFFEGRRKGLDIKSILNNGHIFYESACGTAREILDFDSFRLNDNDKRRWERRACIDEKLSERYNESLEILRTARYKFLN